MIETKDLKEAIQPIKEYLKKEFPIYEMIFYGVMAKKEKKRKTEKDKLYIEFALKYVMQYDMLRSLCSTIETIYLDEEAEKELAEFHKKFKPPYDDYQRSQLTALEISCKSGRQRLAMAMIEPLKRVMFGGKYGKG